MNGLKMVREWAEDANALKPVGDDGDIEFYDSAILGITDDGKLVYSKDEMVKILSTRGDMSEEDAWEFLEFNCFSTYIDSLGPIFANTFT